jgi:hypothetical protein
MNFPMKTSAQATPSVAKKIATAKVVILRRAAMTALGVGIGS